MSSPLCLDYFCLYHFLPPLQKPLVSPKAPTPLPRLIIRLSALRAPLYVQSLVHTRSCDFIDSTFSLPLVSYIHFTGPNTHRISECVLSEALLRESVRPYRPFLVENVRPYRPFARPSAPRLMTVIEDEYT